MINKLIRDLDNLGPRTPYASIRRTIKNTIMVLEHVKDNVELPMYVQAELRRYGKPASIIKKGLPTRAWNALRRHEMKMGRHFSLAELENGDKLLTIKDLGSKSMAMITANPREFVYSPNVYTEV